MLSYVLGQTTIVEHFLYPKPQVSLKIYVKLLVKLRPISVLSKTGFAKTITHPAISYIYNTAYSLDVIYERPLIHTISMINRNGMNEWPFLIVYQIFWFLKMSKFWESIFNFCLEPTFIDFFLSWAHAHWFWKQNSLSFSIE